MAAHIQLLGTLGRQETGVLASVQRLGKDVKQRPGESLRLDELVETGYHRGVVGLRHRVNGNHARCVAHTEDELSSHLPVYIAGQRGQVFDVGNMLLVVKYALVKVADAPAKGNVVVEQFRKLGGCFTGIRVTPRAEGNENLLLLVEGHVTVHHCRETNGGKGLYLAVVLLQNVLAKIGIAVLETVPHGLGAVGPKTVNELVLPLVTALGNGFILLVD